MRRVNAPSGSRPEHPLAGRFRIGALVYGAMTVAAFAIARWRGVALGSRPAVLHDIAPAWFGGSGFSGVWVSLVGGGLLAASTVAVTRFLVDRTKWGRTLRAEFRSMLRGARTIDLVLLGSAAGIAEELLFRGALQPLLGLVATSLIFGAVHFVPRRSLVSWSVWAALMGLLLGGLYEVTGSLVGCIVAHVLINVVNLRDIVRFDPRHDAFAEPALPPSLVPRRRTRSSSDLGPPS